MRTIFFMFLVILSLTFYGKSKGYVNREEEWSLTLQWFSVKSANSMLVKFYAYSSINLELWQYKFLQNSYATNLVCWKSHYLFFVKLRTEPKLLKSIPPLLLPSIQFKSLRSWFKSLLFLRVWNIRKTPYLLFWYFSDDEDDTAELLAELQRIKRDRAEELMQKVSWQAKISKKDISERILSCCSFMSLPSDRNKFLYEL